MQNEPISSSLEDYLEAIAEIIENKGHAHTKDIADRMNVKMPSVTNAIQMLAAKGLIRYQSHTPVTLTVRGTERAAVIRLRHAALKNFFRTLLKLEEDESNQTACKVEHIVGEKVMSRFVTLTEAIMNRTDCEGLRDYLNTTMPTISADSQEDVVALDTLEVGQSGIVAHVSSNLRGIKKFADLGLVSGTLLTLEGHAPFGDLLRVRVMGSSLSMRSRDAAQIWVHPARGIPEDHSREIIL